VPGCTESSFRLPLRAEPWGPGYHWTRPCPVCGEPWAPCAGSLLPCHGGCLLNDRARADLVRRFRNETTPMRLIAEELGVSVGVLSRTLREEGVQMPESPRRAPA